MSLLFETIRLQDGVLHNLEYHNSRLNHSRKELFDIEESIDLEKLIQIPSTCKQGLYKCKVIYGNKEVQKFEFQPYKPRTIKSLRLIEDNNISYSYKYTNRGSINRLLTKRERYDDILIIKEGYITDTSFSNILFFDGDQWLTPATPLLRGTMRSYLIENKFIAETAIKVSDLKLFQKARLINAMNPFDSKRDIKIEKIGY